jgi:hypothetical protein
MKNWDSWESLGLALIMLWFFFAGYVVALGFGCSMSWSTRDVTLYFQEGGMIGPLFVAFLNIARWAFVILTVALLFYGLISLRKTAQAQEAN